MKKILLTGVLLCLTASFAMAAGLNFNWNTGPQCSAGVNNNLVFACDNNDAMFYMVASVVPNIAVQGFNAMDARIDAQSVGPIPAWWAGFNAGACRSNAYSAGIINSGTTTAPCTATATTRMWTNTALGAIGFWGIDNSSRFHVVVGFGMDPARTANLSTTLQYNCFNIAMSSGNTVYVAPDPDNGIDEVIPCAGCEMGVTLVLNQIGLYGSAAADQVTLPMVGTQANNNGLCITWQGGAGAGVCGATPARNTTWGQVKSLYR